MTHALHRVLATGISAAALFAGAAQADEVFIQDVIVQGSLCVGVDCVNGENFGFDTIRMKENNTRIKFQDTSASASFPTVDWQLTANESTNGGLNKFSIESIDNSRIPFTVEYGAGSNALYVDDGGRIGLGTASPVVELHVVNGDSPTLRLEQDGSSGFAAQTWDVAGNETNFFVRDVTNGSRLPFKIRPSTPNDTFVMDSSSLVINERGEDYDFRVESDTITHGLFLDGGTGNLGVGHDAPTDDIHIKRASGSVGIRLETADSPLIARVALNSTTDTLIMNFDDAIGPEFSLDKDGNLEIRGHLITTGGGGACTAADPCDAVFDPTVYTVPSIEEHAAEMWSNGYLPAVGPTGPEHSVNVTKKMLHMLNELEHAHIYIAQLNERLQILETQQIEN